MYYTHTKEYSMPMKINVLKPYATMLMKLSNIVLNEGSLVQESPPA